MRYFLYFFLFVFALWTLLGLVSCGLNMLALIAGMDEVELWILGGCVLGAIGLVIWFERSTRPQVQYWD